LTSSFSKTEETAEGIRQVRSGHRETGEARRDEDQSVKPGQSRSLRCARRATRTALSKRFLNEEMMCELENQPVALRNDMAFSAIATLRESAGASSPLRQCRTPSKRLAFRLVFDVSQVARRAGTSDLVAGLAWLCLCRRGVFLILRFEVRWNVAWT